MKKGSMWANLATSGSCLTSSRISSVLTSTAQQGKHVSNRMKIERCKMTPTLKRFPLPNVCNKSFSFGFIDCPDTLGCINICTGWRPHLRYQSVTRCRHTRPNRNAKDISHLWDTRSDGSEHVGHVDLMSTSNSTSPFTPQTERVLVFFEAVLPENLATHRLRPFCGDRLDWLCSQVNKSTKQSTVSM